MQCMNIKCESPKESFVSLLTYNHVSKIHYFLNINTVPEYIEAYKARKVIPGNAVKSRIYLINGKTFKFLYSQYTMAANSCPLDQLTKQNTLQMWCYYQIIRYGFMCNW